MGWRQQDVSLSPRLLPVRLQRGRRAPPPPDNRAPHSGSPRHPRKAAVPVWPRGLREHNWGSRLQRRLLERLQRPMAGMGVWDGSLGALIQIPGNGERGLPGSPGGKNSLSIPREHISSWTIGIFECN